MNKNEARKWLDSVNAELEALKTKIEPLLAERAALVERRRLLEDLLASFDPNAAERRQRNGDAGLDRPGRGRKYSAIAEHLSQQTVDRLTLSFDEIEGLIGTSLPSSARNYRAWWSTDSSGTHHWVNEWQEVGWRLEKVSLTEGRATFVRR